MKRQAFVRDLQKAGCHFHHHGGNHDVFVNPAQGRKAAVPRHNEIKDNLSRLIRKQLGLN